MINSIFLKHIIFFVSLFSLWTNHILAQQISLAGQWNFAIDREDAGLNEKWYSKGLSETIMLPASMAQNGKGDDISLQTKWTGSIYDSSFFYRPSLAKYRTPGNLKIPFWLTPAKYYVGVAWYQKEINIPAKWHNKTIELFFERIHIHSMAWIDDRLLGENNSLSVAHIYQAHDLTGGRHIITIRVDNSLKDVNVGADSHSVSDHTQGNWNGITGKMFMEPLPGISIADIQVFPDVKNKWAVVNIKLINHTAQTVNAALSIRAKSFNGGRIYQTGAFTCKLIATAADTVMAVMKLPIGERILLWDEFNPALYQLTATLNPATDIQVKSVQFGMRSFGIEKTQFIVNGRPVFLRGTLNNCEFPLTGYPAMNEGAWLRIFSIARAHGLNHMRFHSWCPPEAAFVAADKMGFYLQPEAPTWPNHGITLGDGRFIDRYIFDETNRMAEAYGNHPSFCMLAAGNEPAGKNQDKYLASFVNYWKAKDDRRLYTGASVAMSWPLVPENQYMVKSGPRGLKWTDAEPENFSDYFAAIKNFAIPYITHEMGQWCVFPNFDEIKKYTGVYRAKNFELFRKDLKDHGMADEAKDFVMASGKLQALCYKSEIEKDLRTNGLAGFQLLGLQDFPGQGTAQVGLLDAFWDEKPYINANQFKRFCNATVLLAKMKKFVFTNNEFFEAGIELFHFGKTALQDAVVSWLIKDRQNKVFAKGKFTPQNFDLSSGQFVGTIKLSLEKISTPGQYNLELHMEKTEIANDWDFWVYPLKLPAIQNSLVYYCTSLDGKAGEVLQHSGKVFLNAAGTVVKGKEITMYFTPVFWNTSWFKMRPPHITGMLIKNNHPLFENFPTDYYSNFQWWGIANKAQVMHLEDFPAGFRPLVQPIDTWFMNRRLALIFEAKVGNGRLIVSSAGLSDTAAYPSARQLYYSIIKYMQSDKFDPIDQISLNTIRDLFISPSKEKWDSFTKDSPDELKPIKNKSN